MSSLPPVPVDVLATPPLTPSPRLPWEDRATLGWLEAFVQTVRLLAMNPTEGFARLRQDGDLASPLLFGMLVSWMGTIISQLWNVIFSSTLRDMVGTGPFEQFFQSPSLLGLIGTSVIWPVVFVVLSFIGAGILHLSMMVVGATGESEIGFEGSYKVYGYATVSTLAVVIPIAGGIVAGLWSLVLLVIGLSTVHRCSPGRAVLAVLVPSLVCCLCLMGFAMIFGAVIFDSIGSFSP